MRASFLAVLLLVCNLARAQGTSAGFGMLELPFNARTAAMAEGNVADATDNFSALLNPSLLGGSKSATLSITHQRWIQDVQSNFFFVNIPFSPVSAALSVSATTVGGIEVRDVPGPPIGSFDAHAAVLAGIVAYQIEPDLSLGVTIRHVYEKIYVDEASSLLFDLGAVYQLPFPGISAGIAFQHLGFAGRLDDERVTLPTQTRIGLAYEAIVDEFRIQGILSGTSRATGTRFRVHAGGECTYADIASLRLGYQTGYEARGLSGGVGLVYGNISFDYAYVPFSLGIGTGHLLTLGYRF